MSLIATTRGRAGRAVVTFASSNLFDVLGVGPMLGRVPTPADVSKRDRMPAVLSHEYWRRRFGGGRDVMGTTIDAEGLSLQVVGVLPPAAVIPDVHTDL